MKSKNPKKATAIIFTCLFLALGAPLLFFSCQKSSAAKGSTANNTNIDNIATLVNGKVLTGQLTITSNSDAVIADYNNGQQTIIAQKIPGYATAELPGMAEATVITSPYGIIIQDAATGKTTLLANNDDESIAKFVAVIAVLPGSYTNCLIYGTTIIHAENSPA
jgi:hypothetical protein